MTEAISNPFRRGTQNHLLLERLRLLPILNHEIVRELNILKYTGRISDVRKKLRIQGFDLVARKIQGEVHEYRIIRPRHEDQEKAQAGGTPS